MPTDLTDEQIAAGLAGEKATLRPCCLPDAHGDYSQCECWLNDREFPLYCADALLPAALRELQRLRASNPDARERARAATDEIFIKINGNWASKADVQEIILRHMPAPPPATGDLAAVAEACAREGAKEEVVISLDDVQAMLNTLTIGVPKYSCNHWKQMQVFLDALFKERIAPLVARCAAGQARLRAYEGEREKSVYGEPWRRIGDDDNGAFVVLMNNKMNHGHSMTDAERNRITLCVNFCAGIPDDALRATQKGGES